MKVEVSARFSSLMITRTSSRKLLEFCPVKNWAAPEKKRKTSPNVFVEQRLISRDISDRTSMPQKKEEQRTAETFPAESVIVFPCTQTNKHFQILP